MKRVVAITSLSCALIGGVILASPPPPPVLQYNWVIVSCIKEVIPNDGTYFTNEADGSNTMQSVPSTGRTGSVYTVAFDGKTLQLSFLTQSNVCYILQSSANLLAWQDIPWVFIGNGKTNRWLVQADSPMTLFRLRLPQ